MNLFQILYACTCNHRIDIVLSVDIFLKSIKSSGWRIKEFINRFKLQNLLRQIWLFREFLAAFEGVHYMPKALNSITTNRSSQRNKWCFHFFKTLPGDYSSDFHLNP